MTDDALKRPTFRRRLLRLAWHFLPLIAVLILIVLVILPLLQKIDAKKADLREQQAMAGQAEQVLTNVVTLTMTPGPVQEKISLPGVVKPWITLNVVAEVKGKIISKNISKGAQVKKGDVLAVIDKRDYQLNLDSARASYDTARSNEKRLVALSKKNFATLSQLDDARSLVSTTRAAVNLAKLNLERCTIRAPMDGILDRVFIETGTFLDAGDPVATVLQMDRLKVVVGIPESDVAAVRRLSEFEMTFDALDGERVIGTYNYLFKTTDSMARLYSLEIKLDNPDLRILPDMFARVALVKNRVDQGLAVPIYSLVTQKDKTGVFVEKGGNVFFRPVKTGFQDGWRILVKDGIDIGEHVVVVGHGLIENKEQVNVTHTISNVKELIQ
jgi:RND family efflux transporter MFP subunit